MVGLDDTCCYTASIHGAFGRLRTLPECAAVGMGVHVAGKTRHSSFSPAHALLAARDELGGSGRDSAWGCREGRAQHGREQVMGPGNDLACWGGQESVRSSPWLQHIVHASHCVVIGGAQGRRGDGVGRAKTWMAAPTALLTRFLCAHVLPCAPAAAQQ